MTMGDVSPLKIGVARPRPLGLVKRESIHFDDVDSNSGYGLPLSSKNLTWTTPSALVELGRSKTESDIKRDLKSMRDLQETLRQAALLNIVAAVNHEERPMDSLPPTRAAGSQTAGIKGASILGHTIPTPANKLLVASSSNEGINISHFSHNLQSSASGLQTMPAGSQQSAINQILAQRTRTISIPRPRTQNDQGAFMHKSLLDAKEKLTGMTTFRAGFKKEPESPNEQALTQAVSQAVDTIDESSETKQSVNEEPLNRDFMRAVSCIRGTGIDHNESGHQDKTGKDIGQNNQNGDSSGTQKSMSMDEQRAHNVHQMQVVKRHISTSKKKELMKKLTDIAKCEAVDMTVPITSTDADSTPPIIIMSQQKDHSPALGDAHNTRVNRTKSMTSLNGREDEPRVPSNTRVQSETLHALLNHREAKKKASLNLEEDLKIESINGNERRNNGVDGLYRSQRDPKLASFDAVAHYHQSNPLSHEPFFTEYSTGKPLQSSFSPEFLELRPLEGSPIVQNRVVLTERRRPQMTRRAVLQHTRDKLLSPSPVVYEASFHRPKACMGQVTLVGQSVQAAAESKPDLVSNKPQKQKPEGYPHTSQSGMKSDEPSRKSWSDPKAMSLKHWGSTAKPPSKSPILRTEILDHLQCVGLVNQRPLHDFNKKYNFKASGIINNLDHNRGEDEFFIDDDEEDDDDSAGTPPAIKNTPQYRRSKLYNAFRASEENLSNLVETSGMETETMTGRSMLNQPTALQLKDPVHVATKEPLYMGCSSRVSENDLRSQFHYVSEADEREAHKGANFKVMKAIDQDVYFDFQHKKYRKNVDSPLNTAPDKPRMHFLKIKFNGEAKT